MKYEPLRNYLSGCLPAEERLGFNEIEQIIGAKLPASARTHPAWCSNNGQGHVNAKAWLDTGFRTTEVYLSGSRVIFQRSTGEDGSSSSQGGSFLDRLRAALGGTVTVMPGVDLTPPLWEEEGGEASIRGPAGGSVSFAGFSDSAAPPQE
jgi:hypothetical protein